jgi:hypothetical protein
MMTRRKPMDSWEKVLRGRVMPDTTNREEMTAFFLRKAMIRRQIEDDIQAIDTDARFNDLMSAIENMEKTR